MISITKKNDGLRPLTRTLRAGFRVAYGTQEGLHGRY